MSLRLNSNIEILEPLLLMSATAIDGQGTDIAIEGFGAEATNFDDLDVFSDVFSDVEGEGFDAANSLFAEVVGGFEAESGFAEQAGFTEENSATDQSSIVQPVQAEGFDVQSEVADGGFGEIDLAAIENPFGVEAESGLTVVEVCPVQEVDLPPVAVHDYNFTVAGEAVTGNVLCNDINPNGGDLTAWVSCSPENGSLCFQADGTYTYTPNSDFCGMDEFVYVVTDGQGGVSTTSVTIEVGEPAEFVPVNAAPVAVDDSASTDFETSVSGNVLSNDSDPDGDSLQAWVETGPSNGSIELNPNGSFVYSPNPGFSGTDTFTYSVNDVEGVSTIATVTLEVGDAPVNAAPVAVDDFASTDFETSVSGNVLSNDSDPDGDSLQAWVETGPSNGSIELNPDGSFVYSPNPGFSGTDTFTYSVNDVEGVSTIATVTLEVGDAPANVAPVAEDDFASGAAGTEITGSVLANDYDLDSDQLSVAPVTDFQTVEGGTVAVKQDGTFVYEPAEGYVGVDYFTYTVTDSTGNTATATVVVEVQALPITIQDDSYSVVNNGGIITGVVTENDGSNDPDVIARLVSAPEFGTLVFAEDGSFEYQAEDGFSGRDTFQYVLVHGCQTSAVATASLVVSNVQYDTTHESAGNGRIWGDPHFIGDDGGLYDVQGEAGKIYSVLSDQDLQVNALFIPWEIHPGSTMVGAIGVTSGSDQIVADLDGTVVNGVVIEAGQTVQIAAGTVSYDGQYTTIITDEYELELHRRDGWYDMNLDSLDPFKDNVAPHGLWGLTVDGDTDARNGDYFKNEWDYTLQGGGAIDTVDANGQIVQTERGDDSAYQLYETADLLSLTGVNSEADALFRFAAAEGTGLSPI